MAWYRSYDDDRFPRKLTVGERQAQARAEAARLTKKGRKLSPVVIEGSAIASTFWGKAWLQHLESYSDYESRLPRGRSYARNGSVIDLQLGPGSVRALVSGSKVYDVEIDIEPLALPRWKALVTQCAGKIDSVVELLSGELSDAVMERLVDPKQGLFPSSGQLSLSCSCPDSAGLCKHLAAVLYGIGARFDQSPDLLFVLRGVDKLDLVSAATEGAMGGKKKTKKSKGELKSEELSDIFGIELDGGEAPVVEKPKKKARKKS